MVVARVEAKGIEFWGTYENSKSFFEDCSLDLDLSFLEASQ